MWTQLKRIVRHRFAKGWRNFFSESAMQRLTALVAECEKTHSGEIRICIESSLPQSYLLRPESMRRITRRRALAKFSKLRVWDTEHNNGVLIYLLLPERAIELVADRGINSRVHPDTWARIVASLGNSFQANQFEAGLANVVRQVSEILSQHYALKPGQTSSHELPDRPFTE